MDNELLENLDKLHTTESGVDRIKRNLSLNTDDVVEWCKTKINSQNATITRKGKNWYVNVDRCTITVNAYSYTIITAHKEKTEDKYIEKDIKHLAKQYGADVCGIGNVERFSDAPEGFSPLDIYDECKSVIAVGIALPRGLYEVEPRLIYGHFNAEICVNVDWLTLKLAKEIEEKYRCVAVPVPSDAPNEYWEAESMTAKGLISMKHTAVFCGIGSMGKSSLLINEKYGNRLTIGAILTNLVLEPDSIQSDLCISGCRKCVENCPAQAISDIGVNQKKCRLNAYGKTARGFDTVDCNKCRTVCPMKYGKLTIN